MIGQTLGRYRILEEIGSGGMGVVYRARDERLERDVALKVLPEGRFGDETARKRFREEAKALSKLNHPNIATIHDLDTVDGVDFLVMEYVTGETLDGKLARGALETTEVIRLGIQLAEGLAAAHEQGVVHRDLKPGNLRVTPEGRMKILDFGMALLMQPESDTATTDSRITEAHSVVGTLPYMAPEQLRSELADERTDIYAAGAVLYEMATGKRPFTDATAPLLISAILTQYPAAPREVRREISPSLEKIILRALDKQRDQRYPSAKDLLEALQPSSSGAVLAAQSPPFLELESELARAEKSVFVARKEELTVLEALLDRALAGQGRVSFVTGEAGTGKTALITEFERRAQETNTELIVANGNCNAHTGVGDPYLPFREVLALLTGEVESRFRAGAISSSHATRLWHCLPVSIQSIVESSPDLIDTFIAGRALVDRAESYVTGGSEWLRKLEEIVEQKASIPADLSLPQSVLFEQYAQVLVAMSEWKPVLLVLDDLQWADSGSIRLLMHLVDRIRASRVLILGAYRPEEVVPDRDGERHPLSTVLNECRQRFGDVEVKVGHSGDRDFVNAYLDTESNRFSREFRDAFFKHTGGHSLFTLEVLRSMKDQGALRRDDQGRWVEGDVNWESLPTRVDAMIGERIERLPANLREVLAVAGIEGETFTAEVLAGVQKSDEKELVRLLSGELDKRHHLVTAEGIRRVGSRRLSKYRFRHILFQKYLYSDLDDVERAHLHEDVGNVLETLYGESAEEIAEELARHFQEAGLSEKAVEYLGQAGKKAVQLLANEEAVSHFRRGLDLIDTLPDTPERTRQELAFQLGLAAPMTAMGGYAAPELLTACARARELCERVGETPQLFQALYFLTSFYGVRGEYRTALDLAKQHLRLAERSGDPVSIAVAHWSVGYLHHNIGDLQESREHMEHVIAFYDRDKHGSLKFVYAMDPGAGSLGWAAFASWLLGYPDEALKLCREALDLARGMNHPNTLGISISVMGIVCHKRRDVQLVQEHAESLHLLSTEAGLIYWQAWVIFLQGCAETEEGRAEQGASRIQQTVSAMESMGMQLHRSMILASLAEAYLKSGHLEEGLAVVQEALAFVEKSGERYHEAELYRLEGELHLLGGESETQAAEASFHHAIEIARRQSAKSWELRATTNLARLWQKQGKKAEARKRLAEIYGWFTEGFDTEDLKDAKALLEELH